MVREDVAQYHGEHASLLFDAPPSSSRRFGIAGDKAGAAVPLALVCAGASAMFFGSYGALHGLTQTTNSRSSEFLGLQENYTCDCAWAMADPHACPETMTSWNSGDYCQHKCCSAQGATTFVSTPPPQSSNAAARCDCFCDWASEEHCPPEQPGTGPNCCYQTCCGPVWSKQASRLDQQQGKTEAESEPARAEAEVTGKTQAALSDAVKTARAEVLAREKSLAKAEALAREKVEAEAETQAEASAKPEAKAETEADSKTITATAEQEAHADAAHEVEATAKLEAEAMTKAEAEAGEARATAEAEAEAEAKERAKVTPDAEANRKPVAEASADNETRADEKDASEADARGSTAKAEPKKDVTAGIENHFEADPQKIARRDAHKGAKASTPPKITGRAEGQAMLKPEVRSELTERRNSTSGTEIEAEVSLKDRVTAESQTQIGLGPAHTQSRVRAAAGADKFKPQVAAAKEAGKNLKAEAQAAKARAVVAKAKALEAEAEAKAAEAEVAAAKAAMAQREAEAMDITRAKARAHAEARAEVAEVAKTLSTAGSVTLRPKAQQPAASAEANDTAAKTTGEKSPVIAGAGAKTKRGKDAAAQADEGKTTAVESQPFEDHRQNHTDSLYNRHQQQNVSNSTIAFTGEKGHNLLWDIAHRLTKPIHDVWMK